MYKVLPLLALPLFVSGCADMANVLTPAYVPEPIHTYDKTQYDLDLAECMAAGKAYQPHFHFGTVIKSTIEGATSNSSLIPINPMVPVAGAAGAAVSSTADGLDVLSGQHANVFRHCLTDETSWDHSAVLANPRD